MRGRKFQSKIFELSLGIFRNFRDYFRTIWVEFSRLFWDSQNRIFIIVFRQSRTVLRFGFDPGTDVFGFIFHLGVVLVLVEH